MSTPRDFSIKPFTKGVLKDIPSQFMPFGGLTHGIGVRINDVFIERRRGFRRISDCETDEYILGLYQYLDPNTVPHVFFGDRYHLYHIGYPPTMRYWDDGYPWWDIPGVIWDALEGGIVYELSPWGSTQICPVPSISSESSSSSSESTSSSSVSSLSSSSSQSCTLSVYPFTGRDHRDVYGETSTWIFTNFAGNIIATNYEDPIVLIRGYAYDRYENLSCPRLHARIVDTFQGHLMALNTIDDINGIVVNRIWWSGLDDAEDWDYANLASECGYSDLEPSSMPITGGGRLRDSYIVYQQNMIHQLNYTGGTLVFSRQVINNEIGCMSKGLLCGDGEKHFFFAQNEIYMFDGYSFKPIGINNNDYIYGGLNKAQISRAFSFIDTNTNEVHFVIPWNSDIPNLDCIYDYVHETWTYDDLTMNGSEGATAGCPKVAFNFPYIARVGMHLSSSSSVSSSVSSSCSWKSASSSSSSSTSGSMFPCPGEQEDCACPSYLLSVSGVTGDCNTFPCSELNGTHTLYKQVDCFWLGNTPNYYIFMYCADGYWHIDFVEMLDTTTCLSYIIPHYDTCPPVGVLWDDVEYQDCCDGRLSEAYLIGSTSASSSLSSSSSMSYTCGDDIVLNGDMELWSMGPLQPPDQWSIAVTAVPYGIARDASTVDPNWCLRLSAPQVFPGNIQAWQDIGIHKPMSYWQGKTIRASAWVKSNIAFTTFIQLQDGLSSTASATHSGGGGWELLTVQKTLDPLATNLRIQLYALGNDLTYNTSWFDLVFVDEECSYSSSSSSQSSSSDSFSSERAHADSFIQEVGSTDNDDDWPRWSEWISGEYTAMEEGVPVNQYIKEISEFTPVVIELENDIHVSIGSRNTTDTSINWETFSPFDDQFLVGATSYGRYISFKCIANSLDDYYKVSEVMGQYVIAGRR